ncbi:MAG: ribonuclease HII [archaeon]
MLVAGIDEAGRGPCLGPMVLSIAMLAKKDEQKLLDIGVRDSKQLAPAERERQYVLLKRALLEFGSANIPAEEIDSLRDRKSLNEIEAMRIGQLLNSLKQKPDVVYVDSPDIIEKSFAKRIRNYISFNPIIYSEHKADVNYPIVSAASIIAKVERDSAITELSQKYGFMGSGYPHDEDTISFIRKWLDENNCLPHFVRKSWLTNQRLLDEKFQSSLSGFGVKE